MSQLAQAKGLHDQGVQLFEEARRGLTDALGRMSEASEKLKAGELTAEAKGVWKEKFDAAWKDAKELKDRAKLLGELSSGLQGIEQVGAAPNYVRPMGGDGAMAATQFAGQQLSLRSAIPEDAMLGADPRGRILLSGAPRLALNKLMRPAQKSGGWQALSQAESEMLTAPRKEMLMSPYVDRDGGMITAEEVRNEVLGHLRDVTYIRSRARVIATTAAEVSFPSAKLDLKLVKTRAGIGTGQAPVAVKDIFGKIRFVPQGKSQTILVPQELVDDQTFDVLGFIAEEIAKNDAEDDEQKFLLGSGSGEPLGVVTALQKLEAAGYTGLGFEHSGASGADFKSDDIKKFPYNLRKVYRAGNRAAGKGAAWTSNKTWIQVVSVMRTNEGGAGTGDYIFRQGIELGDPDTVGGYTFLESEFFPDKITSGSAGDALALFGDWSYYWIVDRKSLSIQVLAELYSATDEIGYKYSKRFDAAPVRADAFIYMKRKA